MGTFIKVDNVDYSHLNLGTVTENMNVIYNNEEVELYCLYIENNDEAIKYKLNMFVSGLKTAGIWDKIYAIYPMFGTTFRHMCINLKNPDDRRLMIFKNNVFDSDDESDIIIEPNYGFKYTNCSWTSEGNNFVVYTTHGLPVGNNQHLMVYTDYIPEYTKNKGISVPITVKCGQRNKDIAILTGLSSNSIENATYDEYSIEYRSSLEKDENGNKIYQTNTFSDTTRHLIIGSVD